MDSKNASTSFGVRSCLLSRVESSPSPKALPIIANARVSSPQRSRYDRNEYHKNYMREYMRKQRAKSKHEGES